MGDHPCEAWLDAGACGRRDSDKPMCYRSTPYCCESHRKLLIIQGRTELLVLGETVKY